MRSRALLGLFCIAATFAPADSPASDSRVGDITVVVRGLGSDDGKLAVQLASSREDFESDETGFRGGFAPIEGGTARLVFEQVPYGEYAIKVFHDENENLELDTNFVGIPKESFGFSNNAMGRFGPPDYDAAKFRLAAPALSIAIDVETR